MPTVEIPEVLHDRMEALVEERGFEDMEAFLHEMVATAEHADRDLSEEALPDGSVDEEDTIPLEEVRRELHEDEE